MNTLIKGRKFHFVIIRKAIETNLSEIFIIKKIDSNRVYLLKKARNEQLNLSILNEYHILSKLHHPNIVKVIDFCEISSSYGVILEYLENFDPFYELKGISFRDLFRIFLDLLETTDYLHKKGIIHRDIKPSNILLNRQNLNIKLIDFSTSLDLVSPKYAPKRVYSKLGFTAPEQYRSGKSSVQTDIWSLGATFLFWITNMSPVFFLKNYPGENTLLKYDLLELTLSLIYGNPMPSLLRIIKKCLEYPPENRYQSVMALKKDFKKFVIYVS
ncbi:MAG: serine/threonine protein kinase [Candidatus Njordarchaeia archaeon]